MAGLLMLAACGASGAQQASAPLKPDRTATAFLDRPQSLAAARKSGVPLPVLVLLERNPWMMVIGADSPSFALYEDGTVIYRTASGYRSGKLNPQARAALLQSLDPASLSQAAGGYEASDWTDQPTSFLLFYGSDRPSFVSVYGNMASHEVRSRLPPVIATAYDKLHDFTLPGATPWLPDKLEVMIWPYEYAPDKSIVWPSGWPRLDDPATRKRGTGFSLYLPSADSAALHDFLATEKEKGAVLIGGRKWSVDVRLPFPHEELWMGPRPPIDHE